VKTRQVVVSTVSRLSGTDEDNHQTATYPYGNALTLEFRQIVQHLTATIKDTKDLIVGPS
jgi:hypothetical protein